MKQPRTDIVELRPKAGLDRMTDEGLMAAVAAGDRVACGELFDRYVDELHRFVGRMRGSDRDVVEDLVQIVFLAAFQAAERFQGGSVRNWLFGIAVNQVREYARREIRRKRALEVVAEATPSSTAPGSAHLLVHLPAAIAALSVELRAALVLVDMEGERGRDAAAILGVPEGTLWRRVHLARKAVRAALGGES
ncbi:MAG TPA: sigma-70 family RNA polymerase sigma factor [Kofleriaceae bacterium]